MENRSQAMTRCLAHFPIGMGCYLYIWLYIKATPPRAALTTHELEWLEPWFKLAMLELKCSNRELVYVGNTNVTEST